jgi:hypothetical protein
VELKPALPDTNLIAVAQHLSPGATPVDRGAIRTVEICDFETTRANINPRVLPGHLRVGEVQCAVERTADRYPLVRNRVAHPVYLEPARALARLCGGEIGRSVRQLNVT